MNILNFANSTLDASMSLKKEFSTDASNDCIILCGFYCRQTIDELHKVYDKVIIYNLEPWSKKFFNSSAYLNLIKGADEMWDYDEENIKNLSNLRDDIKLHILKPFIKIEEEEKEFDVLFYGAMNDRRKFILDQLKNKNVNCKILDARCQLYGDGLNKYIAKSKCLLNVKFKKEYPQEQARLIRWIGNGKIFSERSNHNHLGIEEYEYERLVPEILNYLVNKN